MLSWHKARPCITGLQSHWAVQELSMELKMEGNVPVKALPTVLVPGAAYYK